MVAIGTEKNYTGKGVLLKLLQAHLSVHRGSQHLAITM